MLDPTAPHLPPLPLTLLTLGREKTLTHQTSPFTTGLHELRNLLPGVASPGRETDLTKRKIVSKSTQSEMRSRIGTVRI